VRLDDGKFGKFSVRLDFGTSLHSSQTCPRRSGLANNHEQTQSCLQSHLSRECRMMGLLTSGQWTPTTAADRDRGGGRTMTFDGGFNNAVTGTLR